MGVMIYNCKDCTISVKGKLQNVSLNDSDKVKLTVDKIVAYVETSSCKNTEMTAEGQLKTLKVERSTKLKVNLNEATRGCQIISTHSKDIFIEGPKVEKDLVEYQDKEPELTVKIPIADSYKVQFADDKDELTYEPILGFE